MTEDRNLFDDIPVMFDNKWQRKTFIDGVKNMVLEYGRGHKKDRFVCSMVVLLGFGRREIARRTKNRITEYDVKQTFKRYPFLAEYLKRHGKELKESGKRQSEDELNRVARGLFKEEGE